VYVPDVLTDGNPEFLAGIAAVLVALVQSQTVADSGIDRHPYARTADGGELASDLPPESIGRPELEPLLWTRQRRARHSGRR
jgi:hypothetical protein